MAECVLCFKGLGVWSNSGWGVMNESECVHIRARERWLEGLLTLKMESRFFSVAYAMASSYDTGRCSGRSTSPATAGR